MDLSTLDEATFRLIVQLHLDETWSLSKSAKGKGKVGEESDFDIAIREQKRQLEQSLQAFNDSRVARNFNRRASAAIEPH